MNVLPAYLPIDNQPNLQRHTASHGVVNTDTQAKIRYIQQRDRILNEKRQFLEVQEELGGLKKEFLSLRSLVEKYIPLDIPA
jgi:hypothetical protein